MFVEVEGRKETAEAFLRRLVTEAPGPARIDEVLVLCDAYPADRTSFTIVESRGQGTVRTFVSPDIGTCGDCLAELFDPADRRARYPFTNCTNCGPRFTITLSLPYDRPNTTMRGFALCAACASEYHDPADRRFHAQPIACADCGPRLWLEHPAGSDPFVGSDTAIAGAQAALARGEIVAIKGLGGYHLACDAHSDAAVQRLRERKYRLEKPFAVMVRDLHTARTLARMDAPEAELLMSATATHRPPSQALRPGRSGHLGVGRPGEPAVGVLLPYTPLHHLLFAPVPGRQRPGRGTRRAGHDQWQPERRADLL